MTDFDSCFDMRDGNMVLRGIINHLPPHVLMCRRPVGRSPVRMIFSLDIFILFYLLCFSLKMNTKVTLFSDFSFIIL